MRSSMAINRCMTILFLLYILQICACLPTTSQTASKSKENTQGSGSTKSQEQVLNDDDKISQSCLAPGNRQGHCKLLNQCVLGEFHTNFARFIDHLCIVDNAFVGVCCPDDLNETHKSSSNSQKVFVNSLPMIVDDDTKNNVSDGTLRSGGIRYGTPTGKIRGCGVGTNSKTKLVGGQAADPKEWPWMAAIIREKDIQFCGGVLITDRHVLTAAHCVHNYKPRDITVRLGEYDFTRTDETRTFDSVATDIRIHKNFDTSNYENDIAIIKIRHQTVFNTYVWPICLPPIGQSFENEIAIVTGWGTQYYGGPASTVLMEVPVPIWPQKKCASSFTQRIPETAICAGAFEGGRDACQGDSGGPLLHRLRNGRWVTIGVVSWGIRCGEPGHPGIYTRVNSYLDWIFANTIF